MRSVVARSLMAVALVGCAGVEDVVSDPGAPVFDEPLPEVAEVVDLSTPELVLQHAYRQHDDGHYVEAAELLLGLADAFPVARSLAARSLMEDGQLANAYEEAVRAVREAPEFALTHFMLGLVASRDDRAEEAFEAYQRCLELDPHFAAAHNNLGGLAYHREDFQSARDAFVRTLELSTDYLGTSIAEANLAELDALEGRLDLAEARLDRALELTPEEAHPYFQLAVLYDVTGREEAARSMATEGAELDVHGVSRRSISFVWPELELHHDALLAEGRGDLKAARALWSRLAALESDRELNWSALAGRARAHLLALAEPARPFDSVELRPLPGTLRLHPFVGLTDLDRGLVVVR